MKKARRVIAMVTTIALLTSFMCMFASAEEVTEPSELTQEVIDEKIANGEAEIRFDVRMLSEFSQEEIANNEGLQQLVRDVEAEQPLTRATNQGKKDGRVYSATITVDLYTIECFSMPRTEILAVDVGNTGSSDISTRMYVYEYVTIDGVRTEDLSNYIIYGNIEASLGCGANTCITSIAKVSGDDNKNTSVNVDFSSLFSTLTNAAGYSTLSTLLSALGSISFSGSNYQLSTSLTGKNIRVVGAKWKSSVDLNENNSYLTLYATMSAERSFTASTSAYAAAQWTFDVFLGYPKLSSTAVDVVVASSTQYALVP